MLEIDQDLLAAAAELDVPGSNHAAILREKLMAMPHGRTVELLADVAGGKAAEVMSELNQMKVAN